MAVSFETPKYTANADGLGTLRLLKALRILRRTDNVRFYQASTSELYGLARATPQNAFYPRSSYAITKLYAFWMTVDYREAKFGDVLARIDPRYFRPPKLTAL